MPPAKRLIVSGESKACLELCVSGPNGFHAGKLKYLPHFFVACATRGEKTLDHLYYTHFVESITEP